NHRGVNTMSISIKGYNGKTLIEIPANTLQGADLQGADLQEADLQEADLRGADLQKADLWRATLRGADLRAANLQEANLQGANLQEANLWEANLRGADLQGADLRGANLRGAMNIPTITTFLDILKDQPEKIYAYKLVKSNGLAPFNGSIIYEIGKTYSEPKASIDATILWGAGINLATLDWCIKNKEENWKILIAEFTAKDIACIPYATDGKFRVFKCKIVGEKILD
ncbi:MAG: pentapeptide repeat-containing protein, partial [Terriglobales bacterium]